MKNQQKNKKKEVPSRDLDGLSLNQSIHF
jgi:predicted nuclease of restriction endonuclease-like RecB superfamily